MKQNNILQIKSYAFAVNIVHLGRNIMREQKEYILSKQLLRSGTSIGANVEEAIGAQSKKDFIARLSIAYREARETNYWIKLLEDTQIIDHSIAKSPLEDCTELIKILSKILTTLKSHTPTDTPPHS